MSDVGFIFAGGKSRRMGEDKATMFGGVARLQSLFEKAGVSRTVVLAGTPDRLALFEGEVWTDPDELHGLHRLIPWAHGEVEGKVMFVPCDGFLLTEEAIRWLMEQPDGGVPTDQTGRRQPMFACIPSNHRYPTNAGSVRELLEGLPTIDSGVHAEAFTNFNTPDSVLDHQLADRRG